jgi:hypothetical protein
MVRTFDSSDSFAPLHWRSLSLKGHRHSHERLTAHLRERFWIASVGVGDVAGSGRPARELRQRR